MLKLKSKVPLVSLLTLLLIPSAFANFKLAILESQSVKHNFSNKRINYYREVTPIAFSMFYQNAKRKSGGIKVIPEYHLDVLNYEDIEIKLKQLSLDQKILSAFGFFNSDNALVFAKLAESNKIFYLSPAAAAPQLDSLKYANTLAQTLDQSVKDSVSLLANKLKEFKSEEVFFVYIKDRIFDRNFYQFFKDEYKEKFNEIALSSSATDLVSVKKEFCQSKKRKAIVFGTFANNAVEIISAISDCLTATDFIIGNQQWSYAEDFIFSKLDRNLSQIYNHLYIVSDFCKQLPLSFKDKNGNLVDLRELHKIRGEFLKEYLKVNPSPPEGLAYVIFDAITLSLLSIDLLPVEKKNREAVLKSFYQLGKYVGISNIYRIENGKVNKINFFLKWTKAGFQLL